MGFIRGFFVMVTIKTLVKSLTWPHLRLVITQIPRNMLQIGQIRIDTVIVTEANIAGELD